MKKKLYKIPVYRVDPMKSRISDGDWGLIEYLDDIIVKRDGYKATEVITKYIIDDIYPDSVLKYAIIPKSKKNDIYLIAFEDDFNDNNLVTKDSLDDYIDNYKESKFKKVYDETNHSNKLRDIFGGKRR